MKLPPHHGPLRWRVTRDTEHWLTYDAFDHLRGAFADWESAMHFARLGYWYQGICRKILSEDQS